MEIDKQISFQGQYYQDTVPDTFDLAERAALALKGAFACIDTKLHHWMWFLVHYGAKTPSMRHCFPDVDCGPKLLEAMAMLCHMTGDTENQDIFHAYLKSVFDYLEEDGLYWVCRAENDRPWAAVYNFDPEEYAIKPSEDIARVGISSKVGQLCLTLYQASGDDYWLKLAEDIQSGIDKVTIRKDDYAYIPMYSGNHMPGGILRTGWVTTKEADEAAAANEGTAMDTLGFLLRTPCMMYQATESALSRDQADRWARYLMKPKFWGKSPVVCEKAMNTYGQLNDYVGDPSECVQEPICIAGEEQGHWYLHHHSTMRGLRGILEYGMTMSDSVAVEFARRGFDFSWSLGIPKLGWVTEYPGQKSWMEGCTVGDLIAFAIRLSDAGAGDYWDQVDSLVRNVLAEAQYTNPDVMRKISENSWLDEFPGSKANGRSYDGKDIIDKTVGVFLSELEPDGAEMSVSKFQIMFCCMINCMTGLFYAWEGAVREDGDTAHVNLLFNRASKGLDVYSHLPYEGRVEIRNKGKKLIFVHIPGWTKKESVKLTVDGKETAYQMAGQFMLISGLNGTERIEIRFNVPEYSASYTVNARTPMEKKYTIRFRGSNAVDISPRSKSPTYYPFYTDENLRTAKKAGTKTVTRFIPDREIKIW